MAKDLSGFDIPRSTWLMRVALCTVQMYVRWKRWGGCILLARLNLGAARLFRLGVVPTITAGLTASLQ